MGWKSAVTRRRRFAGTASRSVDAAECGLASIEKAGCAQVIHAPRDAIVSRLQARLGLAADALDLDRVGAGEADAVEDLADPDEVDRAAVADGGEVPVLEAAAVVLEMDVADQMLDLLELVAGVDALVVIGDVAGVEVEPDVGMIDLGHQGEHGRGVLGRPLVGLERQGHAVFGGGVAEPAEVVDDRRALGGVRGLAGPRDADRDAEPAGREPDSPLGQLDARLGADVGTADVAAADLDPVSAEVRRRNRLGRRRRRPSR